MSFCSWLNIAMLFLLSQVVHSIEDGVIQLPHKKGYCYVPPAEIPDGCARFYMSDPIKSVQGTKYWQVCSALGRDKSAQYTIGQGVFNKIKDKYGSESVNSVSFISTGPRCWVNIYTQYNLKGRTYEITPLRDVDLSLIKSLDNMNEETFNDNILSGTIRSTDAMLESPDAMLTKPGDTPIATWYRFQGAPRQNTDVGCGYFYDVDPTIPIEINGTFVNNTEANGFVVCLSKNQHLAHVSVNDMTKRGLILLSSPTFKSSHLDLSVEPWTGDAEHEEVAAKKYGREYIKVTENRRLRGVNMNAGLLGDDFFSFLDGIGTAIENAYESTVESVKNLIDGGATSAPTPMPTLLPPFEIPISMPKDIKDLTGIKFVEAGPGLDVAIWTEDEFLGEQRLIKELSTYSMPVGQSCNSFFLMSKVYDRTIVEEAATINKARKYARKEDLKRKSYHKYSLYSI